MFFSISISLSFSRKETASILVAALAALTRMLWLGNGELPGPFGFSFKCGSKSKALETTGFGLFFFFPKRLAGVAGIFASHFFDPSHQPIKKQRVLVFAFSQSYQWVVSV